MTRVLFTGNSHLAAVRLGWDRLAARYPQVDAQFLGAPRETFNSFTRDGFRFGLFDEMAVPKRILADLKSTMPALTVDLRDFDQIVLVGSGWGEISVLGLLQRYGIDGVRTLGPGMKGVLSCPAFDAFCADIVQTSSAADVVARLLPGSVTILPRPMRSEFLLEAEDGATFAGLAAHPVGVLAAVQRHQAVFAAEMARLGVRVVPQPAETLAETGLTLRAYSVGPKVISVRGEARDVVDCVHTTGDYGALVLARMLDDLAA